MLSEGSQGRLVADRTCLMELNLISRMIRIGKSGQFGLAQNAKIHLCYMSRWNEKVSLLAGNSFTQEL